MYTDTVLDVKIVELEPMRVASFYAFGQEPETAAWTKLKGWAEPRGYLDDLKNHRIFGFNNPNPAPGSPNYGYEFWITVGPEIEPESDMRIIDFNGGLYAVTRLLTPFTDPYHTIPEGWKQLVLWVEDSPYKISTQPCLEEHLRTPQTPPDEWSMDLHLAVAK